MIYDTLKHIENYKDLPNIYRALMILRDTDFSDMADGAYEVDGFNFRYMIQSYDADRVNDTPEAHRDFIDIQYLFQGKELVGVGQLEEMTEEVEARPQNDIWFYHGPMEYLPLEGDRFMVLFPNDPHAPCSVPKDGPSKVRKCVFKIHI